jgi:hypothetical protein
MCALLQKNPQSNSVCERMIHNTKYPKDILPNTWGHIAKYMGTHCQIYGDILPNIWGHIANMKYMYSIYEDRLLIQKNIYGISLITMHGMRAGVHSSLGSSLGNLLFNRDMFLNIHLIADWHAITQRREHLTHEKLMRENQERRGYNCAPQQIVLKKKWKPKKLGKRWSVQNSRSPCQWDSDHPTETRSHRKNQYKTNYTIQANRGYAAEDFFGGEGGAWYEKGVTLHGLRISEKKEILCKLTVL